VRGYDGVRRSSDGEWTTLQEQARAAIADGGGPVFVPAGRGVSHWHIRGWAWEDGKVVSTFVHVEKRRGRRARIETRYGPAPDPEPDSTFVQQAIQDAVSFDFRFPMTLDVSRAEIVIPVNRSSSATFTCYAVNDAWTAIGRIDDRSVEIRSFGIAVADLSLRTVDDIHALPDRRWF
jgi:hypothetical protein